MAYVLSQVLSLLCGTKFLLVLLFLRFLRVFHDPQKKLPQKEILVTGEIIQINITSILVAVISHTKARCTKFIVIATLITVFYISTCCFTSQLHAA